MCLQSFVSLPATVVRPSFLPSDGGGGGGALNEALSGWVGGSVGPVDDRKSNDNVPVGLSASFQPP